MLILQCCVRLKNSLKHVS